MEPVCRELDRRGLDVAYLTASPDDPALQVDALRIPLLCLPHGVLQTVSQQFRAVCRTGGAEQEQKLPAGGETHPLTVQGHVAIPIPQQGGEPDLTGADGVVLHLSAPKGRQQPLPQQQPVLRQAAGEGAVVRLQRIDAQQHHTVSLAECIHGEKLGGGPFPAVGASGTGEGCFRKKLSGPASLHG